MTFHKNLLLFLLFAGFSLGYAQKGKIQQKVKELNTFQQKFERFQLLTKDKNTQKSAKYLNSATDVSVLNLDTQELNRIKNEAPNYISFGIPYADEIVEVELYKHNVLTDNFYAINQDGNPLDFSVGQFYRGIVKDDYNSIVAVSIFEDKIMGVISTQEKGNIILGKSKDNQDLISYSDWNLLEGFHFECGVDELAVNQQAGEQIHFDPNGLHATETEKCVKLYYEVAYAPFQMNDSDVQETIDWITGIQNNIGTLYDNDGINMALGSVRIWIIPDPYDGDFVEILDLFISTVTNFDGDLAHLINYPTSTSAAYIDSLCTEYNYAYSGVDLYYNEVPTYSWTVKVMTHEMGHSMGSPHTHACVWNGDNTAIDGCGPQAGYSEGCDGPIPEDGGTIMSYCHLIEEVGVNLLNGFGPQPAQLIRDTVDSKFCLSDECVTDFDYCTYAIENMDFSYLSNSEIEVNIQDFVSNQWAAAVVPYGSTPGENDWQLFDTTQFTISGLMPHQYYNLYVANVCDNGNLGAMRQVVILPGDFCNGEVFTDTGGTTEDYEDNEHFIKTFYPSTENGKVKINFEKFKSQNHYDWMSVYDGDDTSAPLFQGGHLTGEHIPGPEFIATSESGAITIEFISDSGITASGWEATVDCNSLGVNDLSDISGISVYPNPAADIINVVSQMEQIESYRLNDASGKLIITSDLNADRTQININHLPKGVYILTLKTATQTLTKKIIKK